MKKTLLFLFLIQAMFATAQQANLCPFYHPSPAPVCAKARPHRLPSNVPIAGNLFLNDVRKASSGISSQSLIMVTDSIYQWSSDNINSPWAYFKKSVNRSYDSNHNLTHETILLWDTTQWVNSMQSTYNYNSNSQLTDQVDQVWASTSWLNTTHYSYTYNGSGKITQRLQDVWSGSAWVNNNNNVYTYDASGNLLSFLSQGWSGGSWLNQSFYTYTYDVNGNLLTEMFQSWSSGSWQNSEQIVNTYNSQNIQTSELIKLWSNNTWYDNTLTSFTLNGSGQVTNSLSQVWTGTVWMNSSQYFVYYNVNNNVDSVFEQSFSSGGWVNNDVYAYTYDLANNRTSQLITIWNNGAWKNQSLITSVYSGIVEVNHQEKLWHNNAWTTLYTGDHTVDANNFVLSDRYLTYDINGSFLSGDSLYYYFHTLVGLNEMQSDAHDVSVFPNPSFGQFSIRTKLKITEMKVFNLLGEQVASEPLQGMLTTINLYYLPKGVYLLNLQTANAVMVKKIIIN